MEQAQEVRFRVLSLNCWAIAVKGYQCKLRKERIAAIGQHIYDASYEVVALQEVWSQDDYASLCLKLHERLPFSHYFYSGYTGSGVCVFSKYPIVATMWHTFPMSGYAHKFWHADWYGAKGVGLCRLKIEQLTVNLYSTHVHARHAFGEKEEYLAHRTTQMLNLGQFIKHTSETCDAVLLCGDLNTEDGELGYQLLRSQALLKDAWAEKNSKVGNGLGGGETSDKPNNPFINRKSLRRRPDGMRLDYIMYRQNAHAELTCQQCMVTMGQIPNESYFYSDHEAVLASFALKQNLNARQHPEPDRTVQTVCLQNADRLLDESLRICHFHRARYAVLTVLWLLILVAAREQFLAHDWHIVNEVFQVVAAVMTAVCGWNSLVLLPVDGNSLRQHKSDVAKMLDSYKRLPASKESP